MAGNSDWTVSRRAMLKGTAALLAAPYVLHSGRSSAADGKLTIMMLGPKKEAVEAFKTDMLPSFTKASGLEVEFMQSDWGSGFQKVVTAAASGTLPDLIMLGGIWTAPLASKNTLLPLDDYLAKWTDKAQFYDGMLADGTFNGVSYALPLYSDTRAPVYRKDILEASGVNALPKTWDEYKELGRSIAKSATSAANTPIAWGLDKSVGLQQSFAQLVFQAGGTYYGADGKAQFASDAGVQALEYLVGYFKDGLSNVNSVYSGSGPRSLNAGSSGAEYAGFDIVTNARGNAPEAEQHLVAGVPLAAKAGGEPVTSAWINKLAISAKTKNPDGAWALLQHLMEKNSSEKIAKVFGGLPARKDLANASYLGEIGSAFASASEYIIPQPPSPQMLVIAKEINKSVEAAVRGQDTPAAILVELDRKVDQINGL